MRREHHPSPAFKAFRRFNDPQLAEVAGLRDRLSERHLPLFASDGLPDRIASAFARGRVIAVKEMLESFELFERVRRRTRAPVVADVCCGHGLTGLLFAVFERRVERVILVDKKQPPSFERLMEVMDEVAPWVRAKVEYRTCKMSALRGELPEGTSIVAVHACGVRTDRAIDLGLSCRGAMALLPCCYYQTASDAPPALLEALGRRDATDVHRTYRLEAAGYRVDWSAIPHAITAMHRVLVATPDEAA